MFAAPTTPIGRSPNSAIRLVKRLLDMGAALLLLPPVALLLPFLPWFLAAPKARIGSHEFIGRHGRHFRLQSLSFPLWLGKILGRHMHTLEQLPRLFALLDGRLTLVGPRPVTAGELDHFGGLEHPRFSVAPGLVCLWWLRQRSNIDYGTEGEADVDYLAQRSLRRDVAILGRTLVALAYGPRVASWSASETISGIRLLNLSMASLLDAMLAALQKGARARIAFVNPDCVNIAAQNSAYRRSLDACDWVCADGIGMKVAGSMLGRPIRQNLNGTDLFPRLCAALSASGHSLYLLGSRPGVAEAALLWAMQRYPNLKIVGTRSGYFSSWEESDVLEKIRATGADVLLVGMGAPRQELWLQKNLEASGATIGMGVGGLFDFYSGRIPRAPMWLRELGGEWIYRLLQEPGRMWRRYLLGNWIFLFRIVGEKLSGANVKGHVK